MKTLPQQYRESMRFFARMWRDYGVKEDLQRAIWCREQARGWKGGAVKDLDGMSEADRVWCELDEARKSPRVISVSWLEGFKFQVGISAARVSGGAVDARISPFGNGCADAVDAVPGRESESQRSPESDAGAASVICPWCALERAYQGQGPAPRTGYGYARVKSCARHAPVEVLEHPTIAPQPAVARDASPQAPAAALLFPGSASAEPFHPKLNPNAGVRPAYPKGRWS